MMQAGDVSRIVTWLRTCAVDYWLDGSTPRTGAIWDMPEARMWW